jgi:uncharacterized protein (TIGR02466 family)
MADGIFTVTSAAKRRSQSGGARTAPAAAAGEKVVLAFPTPMYKFVWPDSDSVNKALLRIVLEREKTAPSTARSNVGGWQSSHDLLNWPEPPIQVLKTWVNDAFGEIMKAVAGPQPFTCNLSVTAWANLNRHGNYNRSHTHSGNHWSGVYYAEPGEEVEGHPLSGAIEFIDPRPAVNVFDIPGLHQVSTWTIRPEAGMMILFPSWLRHGVLPYEGTKERLTIAFNIRINELKSQPPGPGI